MCARLLVEWVKKQRGPDTGEVADARVGSDRSERRDGSSAPPHRKTCTAVPVPAAAAGAGSNARRCAAWAVRNSGYPIRRSAYPV
eukprot:3183321-Pleurochrysis_carterae.AAC.2